MSQTAQVLEKYDVLEKLRATPLRDLGIWKKAMNSQDFASPSMSCKIESIAQLRLPLFAWMNSCTLLLKIYSILRLI